MIPQFISGSVHFTVGELGCKCDCGLVAFHPGFITKLEELRLVFDRGMIVNSAVRCAKHNSDIGGHPRSLHVADFPYHWDKGQKGCLAIDVKTNGGEYRGDLFHDAWERGWSIGWGNGFLHLDWRVVLDFPQHVFDYG